MNDLIHYLYLSVAGLVISSGPLVFVGHRVKKGHWLLSFIYLAVVLVLAHQFIFHVFETTINRNAIVAVVVLSTLVIAVFEQWNAIGQITFSLACQTALGFLAYSGYVTFFSELGPMSLSFSIFLLFLITFSLSLMIVQTFELMDVVCRIRWQRIFVPKETTDYFPKVSLHVPAYNEPPDMVIETLNALARIDYPNYEVLMIDNNTTNKDLWLPVEAHCKKLGFKFIHLENWPGFKSGALNHAIDHVDPDTEIIGIIDSDYVVEPNYLKDLVGLFQSEKVAFVQTPQDYRDFDENDRYAMACYHAYQYFFKLSMATRNERNGIIFTGTMGLIRRSVLEKVGGWDEWCITEDAEISVKILDMGYESIFVDKTYGCGLMPLNFEGLKKQRFRWAFGGMQVLRLHWRKLLPLKSSTAETGKLTIGQKFDFWSGGLQWLHDPLAFIFTLIIMIGSTTFMISNTVFLQPMAGATLFVPFVFIFFGIVKSLWALRVRLRCSLLQAYRAFLVMLSLTWVVTLACLLGLIKEQGVFLRTPKAEDKNGVAYSFRIIQKEITIAMLCVVCVVSLLSLSQVTATTLLLSGLLLWQTYIYGSAIIVNHWSHLSQKMKHSSYQYASSRTTGDRFRAMVTDTRAAILVTFLVGIFILFYYVSIHNAPDREIAFRTNPLDNPLLPHNLVNSAPNDYVKAMILIEETAAISKDVNKALALWHPDGVVRDANYTIDDYSDDKVWTGIDQVRRRYQEEFRARTYYKLAHKNISVFIEGNKAVVINDLSAELESDGIKQIVHLAKGDRWELTKIGNEWRITSLTFNRVLR